MGIDKLKVGENVVALRDMDECGANVKRGAFGKVVEEEDDEYGALIRWESGGHCNVGRRDVSRRSF